LLQEIDGANFFVLLGSPSWSFFGHAFRLRFLPRLMPGQEKSDEIEKGVDTNCRLGYIRKVPQTTIWLAVVGGCGTPVL
jgi:hypothetical protein